MSRRRLILSVAASIAVGVVATYTVAWACVIWVPRPAPRMVLTTTTATSGGRFPWPAPVPGDWPCQCSFIANDEVFGVSAAYATHCSVPFRPTHVLYAVDSGWPLRAVSSTSRRILSPSTMSPAAELAAWFVEPAIPIPHWIPGRSRGARALPLAPRWPGFLVNSAMFASLTFCVITIPGPARGVWRRWHGRCPRCAYMLGTSGRCPECGHLSAPASPNDRSSRQRPATGGVSAAVPKRTASQLALDLAARQVESDGWATTPPVVDSALLDALSSDVRDIEAKAGLRNLLDISKAARALASSDPVRHIPEALLGPRCFVTRAILFDKTPDANWKVPWHQDLAVAVAARRDIPGFGPWSVKDGVVHVQPPASILARMVTVRVHLDDCGLDNGPVRVLPRTHGLGKLDAAQIEKLRAACTEVACTSPRGGLLVFKPLLLHSSSASTNPGHRRVAHFEFAAEDLPAGLDWHARWS